MQPAKAKLKASLPIKQSVLINVCINSTEFRANLELAIAKIINKVFVDCRPAIAYKIEQVIFHVALDDDLIRAGDA